MDTLQNNKLIAEFMGINLKSSNASVFDEPNLKYFRITEYKRDGLCEYCHNGVSHGHNIRCYVLDEEKLHYHESWDWLMPVVEKIEHGLPPFEDGNLINVTIGPTRYCSIQDSNGELIEIITSEPTKIRTVYNAVVEFIEWYNENNL